MKNILFIAHSGNGGGADNVLSFTINNTFKDIVKYKRFVIYPKFQGLEFKKSINSDVFIKSIFYRSNSSNTIKSLICNLINIPGLIYLIIFCFAKKINVIYVNTSVNLIGIVLAFLVPAKVIWHIHEQPNHNVKILPSYLYNLYKKLFLNPNNNIIFVSKHSKKYWESYLDIKLRKDFIVHPPVKTFKKLIPIVNENIDFSFGYLGALVNEKNVIFLLEAFNEVVQQRKSLKIKLVISGNGFLFNEILLRCDEFGISKKVEILKYNSDVSLFFSKIDVLVQPSFNESWGLVALEAMSYEKAVIMTRESGLRDIFIDEKDCLFVNPLKISELIKKMIFLLDNKLDRENIARNGYLKFNTYNFNENFNNSIISIVDN